MVIVRKVHVEDVGCLWIGLSGIPAGSRNAAFEGRSRNKVRLCNKLVRMAHACSPRSGVCTSLCYGVSFQNRKNFGISGCGNFSGTSKARSRQRTKIICLPPTSPSVPLTIWCMRIFNHCYTPKYAKQITLDVLNPCYFELFVATK